MAWRNKSSPSASSSVPIKIPAKLQAWSLSLPVWFKLISRCHWSGLAQSVPALNQYSRAFCMSPPIRCVLAFHASTHQLFITAGGSPSSAPGNSCNFPCARLTYQSNHMNVQLVGSNCASIFSRIPAMDSKSPKLRYRWAKSTMWAPLPGFRCRALRCH